MQNWLKYSLALVMCLELSACALLGPAKTSPVNTYALSAGQNTPAKPPAGEQVLLVTAANAAPGYQGSAMIYTVRPYELKSFTRNRWAAPPADMLTALLVQNLYASGCFAAVVTAPFIGNADLVLSSQLLRLQQEFTGATSQVRMAVRITVSNNKTQQIIANQQLEVVAPAGENNPYAGVVAANRATQLLLGQVRPLVCHLNR